MNVLYDYRVFSGQTIIENFYPRIASRIRNIPVNASSSFASYDYPGKRYVAVCASYAPPIHIQTQCKLEKKKDKKGSISREVAQITHTSNKTIPLNRTDNRTPSTRIILRLQTASTK